jgi:hypothetical protein
LVTSESIGVGSVEATVDVSELGRAELTVEATGDVIAPGSEVTGGSVGPVSGGSRPDRLGAGVLPPEDPLPPVPLEGAESVGSAVGTMAGSVGPVPSGSPPVPVDCPPLTAPVVRTGADAPATTPGDPDP